MRHKALLKFIPLVFLLAAMSITGVFATWVYGSPPTEVESSLPSSMGRFTYGTFYITNIAVNGENALSATAAKTGATTMSADLELQNNAASSVTVEVTFFNSTVGSYYYDETVPLVYDNADISFTVSGMNQKDEVPSNSYATLQVTFDYATANLSARQLLCELDFKFTPDKSAIGDVVANAALAKFEEILNTAQLYNELYTSMNDRITEGWFPDPHAGTYIGNVAGANDGNSQTVVGLFGQDVMDLDLDGDGTTEPVTMMVKRLNLDDNNSTGDSYSYTYWGSTQTVAGVEMTLYITANDWENTRSGDDVVVYAATYTKYPGSDEWVQLVPLTKGVASANNYSGGGGANSFDTDTWESEGNQSMKQLVDAALS